jgi:hypothetical protein
MTKNNDAFGSGMDLKEFFEASVSALQSEGKSLETRSRTDRRNRALVNRTATDDTLKKRAVADAARALTALWKLQTAKRTV